MCLVADPPSLILGMPSSHRALPRPSTDVLLLRIDHLYAIDVIDRVHKAGGKIQAFRSFCGGLPAPESKDIVIMKKTN